MTIDGVSFNDNTHKHYTREQFIKAPMHANHYKHLKGEEKETYLGEVYDIIKKNADNPKSDTAVATGEKGSTRTGKLQRTGNEGGLSESANGTTGKGTDTGK